MDALVSKAATILLSLHPGPASETSAFNRMRAFNSRRAGPFPLRISVSSCWRSSPLSLTTYFFTEISFLAIILSIVRIIAKENHDQGKSPSPFKLVETSDGHHSVRTGRGGWVGAFDRGRFRESPTARFGRGHQIDAACLGKSGNNVQRTRRGSSTWKAGPNGIRGSS